MTSFAIKTLLALTLLFGLWNPAGARLVAAGTGKPSPMFGCSADFAVCAVGEFRFPLAEKSSVLGKLAERAGRHPRQDFQAAITDKRLLPLLDQKVVPESVVDGVQNFLAAAADRALGHSGDKAL